MFSPPDTRACRRPPAPLSPSFRIFNFKSSILLFAASSNFTSFTFFAAVVMALPIVLPISPTLTPLSSFSSSICRAFNLAALSSNTTFSSLNLAARSLAALVAGLDVGTEATMARSVGLVALARTDGTSITGSAPAWGISGEASSSSRRRRAASSTRLLLPFLVPSAAALINP